MGREIHVAVAVILNPQRQVLLALRQSHQHQGGLWEFPGGKVETNESAYQALIREVAEELGVTVSSAEEMMKISHSYGDKSVLLDVWRVKDYAGQVYGKEGQQLRWCDIDDLIEYDFPAANGAIIHALQSENKIK